MTLEQLLRWAKKHELFITIYGNGWTEVEGPFYDVPYAIRVVTGHCGKMYSAPTLLSALRKAKQHIDKENEK
jgi:hypothetical protein